MLAYSICKVRRGRQAARIRAVTKASAQIGLKNSIKMKNFVDDLDYFTIALQKEKEHHSEIKKLEQSIKDI